mgnify:FL=1
MKKDFNEELWEALKKVYGSSLYSAKTTVVLKEPNGIMVNMTINFPPKEEFFE